MNSSEKDTVKKIKRSIKITIAVRQWSVRCERTATLPEKIIYLKNETHNKRTAVAYTRTTATKKHQQQQQHKKAKQKMRAKDGIVANNRVRAHEFHVQS